MKFISSLAIGFLAGIVSVLIHQSLPPVGVIGALVVTYSAIWWVGRESGRKSFKALAALTWFAVIYRAGNLGAGNELLIQADSVGTALFFMGTATALTATLRRI